MSDERWLCVHYVNGRRVWCPSACRVQSSPRPATALGRWRWKRIYDRDAIKATG